MYSSGKQIWNISTYAQNEKWEIWKHKRCVTQANLLKIYLYVPQKSGRRIRDKVTNNSIKDAKYDGIEKKKYRKEKHA